MGIDSLLKVLKSVTKKRNVSEYKNLTVGVDTYCWLHKAIYSCAQELSEGRETTEYINYCIKKVDLLRKHNIKVVMVFDGAKLPSKKSTEEEREKKRNENLQKHNEYKMLGEKEKAYQKLAESIDVTPLMAFKLLEALKAKNIECIVAPFEADAQLAYLSITEYVDIVITEDSDLLAYGAKRVLFKLDKFGTGEEISFSSIQECSEYNFQNWDHQKFLTFCVMAGCDYLDSVNGIGIKRAYQAVAMSQNYQQAIDLLQRKQKIQVPFDYVDSFEKAYLTFLFQRVFCPVQRKMVSVNDFDTDLLYPKMKLLLDGDLSFLGTMYEDKIIQQIADGILCPQDLKPYQIINSQPKQNSQQINDGLQFEVPQLGNNKHVQVFKFMTKSQKSQIQINSQLNQIQQEKQKTLEEIFAKQQQSQIIIQSNPQLDQKLNQQNYLFESQQLTNNNILQERPKKQNIKINIKRQQPTIDQYFSQSKFKPFKPPTQITQMIVENNSFQTNPQNQVHQSIEEEKNEQYHQIESNQFEPYSISEEIHYTQNQKFAFTEFGQFLNEELKFLKLKI